MLDERIIKQLRDIGEKSEKIDTIILFGSRAIGDHQAKSDIDLAFVTPKMTEGQWAEFTFNLEEQLDTFLKLDLIKYETASTDLKNIINKTGKQLYSANPSRSNLKTT